MARLVSLLLEKLAGFLGQLFLGQGILGNIKVLISYLVTADDVRIQDLNSAISLIVEALRLEAKEVTQTEGDPQKEAEASCAYIAGVLKKQLELIKERIKELEKASSSNKNFTDDSTVCKDVGNDGVPFGPLLDDTPTTTDGITFPD